MAKTVTLIHPQQTFQVLEKLLIQKCDLCKDNPSLTASPYIVRSHISQSDFRTFVSALEGASVPLTKDNLLGLTLLCEEFHFGELSERLSQFRDFDDVKEGAALKDLEARKRLSALEERMQERNCQDCRRICGRKNRLQSLFSDAWRVSIGLVSSSLRWNSVILSV
jgi:hypothetical protein